MGSRPHVALLRGINVGGRNRIAITDLRDAFTEGGFTDVSTYIQSGNVLFRTDRPAGSLEREIETALERRFGVPLVVVCARAVSCARSSSVRPTASEPNPIATTPTWCSSGRR